MVKKVKKSSEDNLSSKAKSYLENLRKQYGDMALNKERYNFEKYSYILQKSGNE